MKRFVAVAVGVAAALSLAACGDDDKGSGGGSMTDEQYCDMIKSYTTRADEVSTIFDASNPDPAAMEQTFTEMKDMLDDLEAKAPASIKADVGTMVDATSRMIEIFDKYDYDFTKMVTAPELQELSTLIENEEVAAASERLDQYSEDVCGIPADS